MHIKEEKVLVELIVTDQGAGDANTHTHKASDPTGTVGCPVSGTTNIVRRPPHTDTRMPVTASDFVSRRRRHILCRSGFSVEEKEKNTNYKLSL